MVINAAPAAEGIYSDSDIGRAAGGQKVTDGTVARLIDEACFGGNDASVGFFVFNAAQEPVGDV